MDLRSSNPCCSRVSSVFSHSGDFPRIPLDSVKPAACLICSWLPYPVDIMSYLPLCFPQDIFRGCPTLFLFQLMAYPNCTPLTVVNWKDAIWQSPESTQNSASNPQLQKMLNSKGLFVNRFSSTWECISQVVTNNTSIYFKSHSFKNIHWVSPALN